MSSTDKAKPTDLLRRLSFVNYVHNLADRQSRLKGPRGAPSILLYHDAVDLWLQLAAEYLKIDYNRLGFERILGKVSEQLREQGKEFQYRRQMITLNDTRNALKHHGIWPDHHSIETTRVHVAGFLAENTLILFEEDYDHLSLLSLVEEGPVKKHLAIASELFAKGDARLAMAHATWSFHRLFSGRYHTPLRKSDEVFYTAANAGRLNMQFDDETHRPSPFEMELLGQIKRIEDTVSLLNYGIDTREYFHFKKLMPEVAIQENEGHEEFVILMEGPSVTVEECRLFIQFAIDCALQVQGHGSSFNR